MEVNSTDFSKSQKKKNDHNCDTIFPILHLLHCTHGAAAVGVTVALATGESLPLLPGGSVLSAEWQEWWVSPAGV